MGMYELSITECKRRLGILASILDEELRRDPGFICDCGERSRLYQEALIERAKRGEAEGLEELLGYYRNCITAWAKDLCPTEASRVVFKAELLATLMRQAATLDPQTFCRDIHLVAARVAIAEHEHVLKTHQLDQASERHASSTECEREVH